MLGYAVSLAANFFTSRHPVIGSALIIVAVVGSLYLFWPEITNLRIHNPKNIPTESPLWLYIFGFAAVGMVVVAGGNLYFSSAHAPALLTSEEFAESYVHGKYFKIADLADTQNIIEGRTFEDCWIYGPAVLWPQEHNDISLNNEFQASPEQAFMVGTSNVGNVVGPGTGIIVLRDCKFRHCHFVGVTFIGVEDDIKKWRSGNKDNSK